MSPPKEEERERMGELEERTGELEAGAESQPQSPAEEDVEEAEWEEWEARTRHLSVLLWLGLLLLPDRCSHAGDERTAGARVGVVLVMESGPGKRMSA